MDSYLNDGEHNDNDKEEEGDVKSKSEVKVLVSRRLKFITDSTTGSDTCVEMELEAGEHVVALVVILAVLTLVVIAFEEVEGQDRVEVDDDRQQTNSQHKLLAIVSY